jgi:hypothetical protein
VPSFSNSKTWIPSIDEVIQEALERIGGKFNSAEEIDSCMRSLNYVLKDLMNRGKPLFTLELKTLDVVASVRDYSLSVGILDIMGPVVRVSGRDLPMNRISFLDYQNIVTKNQSGSPIQYTTTQNQDNTTLKIWPTPDANQVRQILYYAVESPDDVTKMFQTPDVSRRYIPCITAGLAYYMAQKMPAFPTDRIQFLKAEWEEQLNIAFSEDRELTSYVTRPASNMQLY